MSKRSWSLRAAVVTALMAGVLSGQSFTAALRGVVTDSSGSAIPGAIVTVTEKERSV